MEIEEVLCTKTQKMKINLNMKTKEGERKQEKERKKAVERRGKKSSNILETIDNQEFTKYHRDST